MGGRGSRRPLAGWALMTWRLPAFDLFSAGALGCVDFPVPGRILMEDAALRREDRSVDLHLHLAYIDPVSGSILIQTVLAAIAGGVAFFRRSLWALLRRFTGGKTEEPPVPPVDKDAPTR